MSTYLFVDLSNFCAGYQSALTAVFGRGQYTPRLELLRQWFEADRVYVYDGFPRAPRPNESSDAFEQRRDSTEMRLKEIARLDDVFVRSGSQSRSSKVERPLEQKEVDVLLAVELVTNAFRGTVKHAILFSGDLDYRPAVHAAVEAGTRVTVACFRHQLSSDRGLIEAADRWAPLLAPWCASICEDPTVREAIEFVHRSEHGFEQWGESVPLDSAFGLGASAFLTDQGRRVAIRDSRCGSWAARPETAEEVLRSDYGAPLPPQCRRRLPSESS